jgi:hypothetical protein
MVRSVSGLRPILLALLLLAVLAAPPTPARAAEDGHLQFYANAALLQPVHEAVFFYHWMDPGYLVEFESDVGNVFTLKNLDENNGHTFQFNWFADIHYYEAIGPGDPVLVVEKKSAFYPAASSWAAGPDGTTSIPVDLYDNVVLPGEQYRAELFMSFTSLAGPWGTGDYTEADFWVIATGP